LDENAKAWLFAEPPRIVKLEAEVRDRLGNVALWLRNHSIDIKVIEIEVY
jgi:hypothetical protein